jgi:ribonucleoside-diphosphate reductase alpha chain
LSSAASHAARSVKTTAAALARPCLILGARRQKWIDQSQSLNIYMAGASGKRLDETYKLAWLRGLKTTYYLRSLGATHAEKSTSKAGQLNAVPSDGALAGAASADEAKFCAIDNSECEACQ